MTIYVAVSIKKPLDQVRAVEAANNDLLDVIRAAARKYIVSHKRLVRDGEVLDFDEFVDQENLEAFYKEAGHATQKYADLLGGVVTETRWYTPPPKA